MTQSRHFDARRRLAVGPGAVARLRRRAGAGVGLGRRAHSPRRRPPPTRLRGSASPAPPGSGATASHPIFNLTTKTGYISLPDGNTAFMWGYSSGFDAFQHPGPVLCVNEGDTVTVILHNTLPGGVLDRLPRPGGRAGRRRRLPARGQRRRHDDLADRHGGRRRRDDHLQLRRRPTPAPILYESGTNPEKQVRMGLFGALIVRPALGADFAYNRRRQPVQRRPRSSWCCSRRSTPTSTRRSSRARPST